MARDPTDDRPVLEPLGLRLLIDGSADRTRSVVDGLAAPSWWRYASTPGRAGWVRRRPGSWTARIAAVTGIFRIGPGTDRDGWLIATYAPSDAGTVLELVGMIDPAMAVAVAILVDASGGREVARWDPRAGPPPRPE